MHRGNYHLSPEISWGLGGNSIIPPRLRQTTALISSFLWSKWFIDGWWWVGRLEVNRAPAQTLSYLWLQTNVKFSKRTNSKIANRPKSPMPGNHQFDAELETSDVKLLTDIRPDESPHFFEIWGENFHPGPGLVSFQTVGRPQCRSYSVTHCLHSCFIPYLAKYSWRESISPTL